MTKPFLKKKLLERFFCRNIMTTCSTAMNKCGIPGLRKLTIAQPDELNDRCSSMYLSLVNDNKCCR